MLQPRQFRAQPGQHLEVVEAAKPARQDQRRGFGEAENELDLAGAEIAVELAERDAGQHRRIERDGELAPVRQLDRDDIVGPSPSPTRCAASRSARR